MPQLKISANQLATRLNEATDAGPAYRYLPLLTYRLCLFLVCLGLSACALSPQEIGSATTNTLCQAYAAPMGPQFMSPELRHELIRRGSEYCTTPEYVQARAAAAYQAMGTSMQLLQMSQPQTITPAVPAPTLQQPIRCTSQYNAYTKQMQTICY